MFFSRYYQLNPVLCQLYSFFFFWSFLALLLIQVALAVNRWTIVCSDRFHFTARSSLVTGCLCWLLALLVLLFPLITTGSSHFGWDQQLGLTATKNSQLDVRNCFFRNLQHQELLQIQQEDHLHTLYLHTLLYHQSLLP